MRGKTVLYRSEDESRRVGRLVESIQHITRCRVMALVCLDEDDDIFVTPRPGCEIALVEAMAGVDWKSTLLTTKEFFTG